MLNGLLMRLQEKRDQPTARWRLKKVAKGKRIEECKDKKGRNDRPYLKEKLLSANSEWKSEGGYIQTNTSASTHYFNTLLNLRKGNKGLLTRCGRNGEKKPFTSGLPGGERKNYRYRKNGLS